MENINEKSELSKSEKEETNPLSKSATIECIYGSEIVLCNSDDDGNASSERTQICPDCGCKLKFSLAPVRH